MTQSFGMIPEAMAAVNLLQQGAATGITTALSTVTSAELASFASALGPIAVTNMIPAYFEATGNNVTSGMGTAMNHALLGVSTEVAQATYTMVDTPGV